MIFPRYHQLDVVRKLVADVYANGTGHNYLIQHSAGSGKSNSISWLAHHLSNLHDKNDKVVFNSIIVITDKRWCEDNAENPLSPKSFANQLSQNAERYHLEPVSNLHIGGGKRCRGYMGIYVLLSPMEL